MNSLDEFKKTKKQFKQTVNKLEDILETIDDSHDFKKLSTEVMKARELKMEADKLQLQMN